MSEVRSRIDELFDRALETMKKIASKRDDEDLGPVLSWLDDLEDVIDEAEDIISRVELSDLVGSVEWGELPEAFDMDDLYAAIDDDEDAVTLGKLLEIIDMSKLWGSMNAREAWREKREFEDELEDVTDDEDDSDGMDGSDSTDPSMPRVDFEDFDPETAENAIQSQISDSVEEFRETLIDAHVRLKEFRENNKDRFEDRRRNRSRNPTFVSTLPPRHDSLGRGTRFSTVPRETKYSTAPNRDRIYGNRFEKAADTDES